MALSKAAINCTDPCFPDSDYEDTDHDDEFSAPSRPSSTGRKKKQVKQVEPSFDEFSIPSRLPSIGRKKKHVKQVEPSFDDSDYDSFYEDEFSIPTHLPHSARKKKQAKQTMSKATKESKSKQRVPASSFGPIKIAGRDDDESRMEGRVDSFATGSMYSDFRQPDEDDHDDDASSVSFGSVPRLLKFNGTTTRKQLKQAELSVDSEQKPWTKKAYEQERDPCAKSIVRERGKTTKKSAGILKLPSSEDLVRSLTVTRVKKFNEEEHDSSGKNSLLDKGSNSKTTSNVFEKLISKGETVIEKILFPENEILAKNISEEVDSLANDSLLEEDSNDGTSKRSIGSSKRSKSKSKEANPTSAFDPVIEHSILKKSSGHDEGTSKRSTGSSKKSKRSKSKDRNPPSIFDAVDEGSNQKNSSGHDEGMSQPSVGSSKASKRSESKEKHPIRDCEENLTIIDLIAEGSNSMKSSGHDDGMSQRSVVSSKETTKSKSKEKQLEARVSGENQPTRLDPVVQDKTVTWDLNPGTFRRVHTYAYPPGSDSRRATPKRLLDLKTKEDPQVDGTKNATQVAAPDTKKETKLSQKTKDSILWWLPTLPSFGSFIGRTESEKPAEKSNDDKAGENDKPAERRNDDKGKMSKKELEIARERLVEGMASFNTRNFTELVEQRRAIGIADLEEVRANVEKVKASIKVRKNQRSLVQSTVEERMKKSLKVVEDGLKAQEAIEERMAKYREKYTNNWPKPLIRKKSFKVAGLVDSPPVKYGMKTTLEGSEEKQLKAAKSKSFDFEQYAREELEPEEIKIYSRPLRARRPAIHHQLKPFREAWDDMVEVSEGCQSILPTCA